MNIWLKEITSEDGKEYYDILMELSSYKDAYAKPLWDDEMSLENFEYFKQVRLKMKDASNIPESVMPTSTYWIMNESEPIGYATLKHKIDPNKPGGHFGCCLIKRYQNKGIGSLVADELSRIAFEDLGIEEVIYTSKNENIQSQKSVDKIGATLIGIHDGYHFYSVDLRKKFNKEGRNV